MYLIGFLLVANGFEAGAGNDHGFSPTADAMANILAEVLDDNFSFLRDIVRVEAHEAGEGFRGFLFFDLGIVLRGFQEFVVDAVDGVVLENIKDEPFLYGLPH